jgi:hypothetical protein
MTQPENHPAIWFGLIITYIARISANSAVSVIDIADDFKLEVGLSGGCLDICGFPFVVPEEYFCQTVTSEVNVVRAK